jgi:hypothetical protein
MSKECISFLLQKNMPMRHKQIIGFNVHPGMKFALDWGLNLVSPKLKDRVKVRTNIVDLLHTL